METENRILLYGYGNPGRSDDGLGPQLTDKIYEWIKKNNITGIDVDSNYQLNIEDAYTIKDYDIVVFADASLEELKHFVFERVKPSDKTAFNTHSVSTGYVLKLCQELYKKDPAVFLMHIKGYDFEFKEGLSENAAINLDMAMDYLLELLVDPDKFFNINSESLIQV